jgi:ATP-binding cassette subfamily C protein CydCD
MRPGSAAAAAPAGRGPRAALRERRLLAEARAARPAIALAAASGTAQSGLLALQAAAIAGLVGAALRNPPRGQPAFEDVVLVALAGLGRALVANATVVGEQAAATRVKRQLRDRLLAAAIGAGPAREGRASVGEVSVLATRGLDALDAYFGRYLPELLLALCAPVVLVGFVLGEDWVSAVALVSTLALLPGFMALLGAEAEERMARQWLRLERLGGHFLDAVRGLPTLRLFGRVDEAADAIARTTDDLRLATLDTLRYALLSALVLELLASLSTALVAAGLGLRLVAGDVGFARALAVLLVAPEVYLPLRRASARFHDAAEGVGAATALFGLIDAAPASAAPPKVRAEEARLPRRGRRSPPSLELHGVSLSFPGRAEAVLDGLELSVPAGCHVALVGPSGSGKSALVWALAGFLRPARGRILADGEDVAELSHDGLAGWRRRVSFLPQRPTLFSGTIRDNFFLAADDASPDEIARALEAAGATELVERLPEGLDARLAESGTNLSSGERQRIALARALARPAGLYLLDEPTAHLDEELGEAVASRLWHHLAGASAVVVTHDPALAEGADLVVDLGSRPGAAPPSGAASRWSSPVP